MKKFIVFVLLSVSILSLAKKSKKPIAIDGFWSDSTSTNFTNCYAQFTQKGDSVFMTHFLEFQGQPFFERGVGIIKGDSLIYNVVVIHKIEGWATTGKHALKLSKDGKTLEGTIFAGNGYVGPITFRRRNN